MTDEFVRLPIRGLDIMRVELVAGRFVALIVMGFVRQENGKHTLAEYLLQFNRTNRTKITTSSTASTAITDLEVRAVPPQSGQNASYDFRILLDCGSIEITAFEFVCSLIREDKFSDTEEQRWATR